MNQALLEDLLRLFALLATEDGLEEAERRVVRDFLAQEFNDIVAAEYLARFDEFVAQVATLPSTRALCEQIARDLTSDEKCYLVVRLMELAGADDAVSETEAARLEEIAEVFGIVGLTFLNLFEFITTRAPRKLLHDNILIISSEIASMRGRFIAAPHLVGYWSVLRVRGFEVYLLRYIGNGEAYLNGQQLVPRHVYFLNLGSVLRAPRVDPLFFTDIRDRFTQHEPEDYIRFEANDLSYAFPGGKEGLRDINITEETGRLVALMGASGAGKSTLLNVLNGNLKPNKGTVSINGIDIYKKAGKQLEGVVGYVSQDDLLIEELTVYQNLFFNAQLCFSDWSKNQLNTRVEETLTELGLLEIAHLPVGNPMNKKISGGQRKRLNIALELIRQPAVLFVDEPTSGLSSRDSENVMALLKELSHQGKLIFVVIHQPSSDIFKLFDRLYILDTGGYPVFYGKPLQALSYFRQQLHHVGAEGSECPSCGTVNVEQIFNLLEERVVDEFGAITHQRKISPSQWHDRYKEHNPTPEVPPAQDMPPPTSTLSRPSWLRQVTLFLKRDALAKFRNKSYLWVNLLEAPVLAIILGYVLRYHDPAEGAGSYSLWGNPNLPSFIFVSVLVALFLGLTVSAEEILRDRRIRKREEFLHLSRSSYLVAKLLWLFSLSAVQMASYVFIGNWVFGIEGLGWEYTLALFFTACFANLLGLNISATFDNAVTIYVLIPLLLIPQIVLSGAIVRFDRLNPTLSATDAVPITGQLMASRWVYEALSVVQFRDNPYQRHFYESERILSEAKFVLNFWIPEVKSRLDAAQREYMQGTPPAQQAQAARHLHVALTDLNRWFPGQEFPFLKRLSEGKLASRDFQTLERTLDALRVRYGRQQREALARRDAELTALATQGIDVNEMKRRHHNEALMELVTNQGAAERIVQIGDRLVQLADPVYKLPRSREALGTASHFYAPAKFIMGSSVDTFTYNLGIIGLMCVLLYLTLYYEFFRFVLERISRLRLRLRRS